MSTALDARQVSDLGTRISGRVLSPGADRL
jgi:hypothetical protein